MDKYDSLILEIIQTHKQESPERKKIHLRKLEKLFWQEIETDPTLSIGKGRVGARITELYVNGFIENKNGYGLTRKGKLQLSVLAEQEN